MVTKLNECGVSISSETFHPIECLFKNPSTCKESITHLITGHFLNPNWQDPETKNTLLHHFIEELDVDFVIFLIEQGAKLKICNKDKQSPLKKIRSMKKENGSNSFQTHTFISQIEARFKSLFKVLQSSIH